MRLSDAERLVQVYGDETATRHLSFTPRTADQCVAVIQVAIKDAQAENRTVYMLAVVTPDDELVGAARLAIDERPHSAQIGFALKPGLWGQRLGGETVRLLLDLGFGALDLKRIWGARAPDNERSRRVMLSAGMVEEGRIRRHLRAHGAWRDSIVHSVLDDEWKTATIHT